MDKRKASVVISALAILISVLSALLRWLGI